MLTPRSFLFWLTRALKCYELMMFSQAERITVERSMADVLSDGPCAFDDVILQTEVEGIGVLRNRIVAA